MRVFDKILGRILFFLMPFVWGWAVAEADADNIRWGQDDGIADISLNGNVYVTAEFCSALDCRDVPPNLQINQLDAGSQVFITAKFFGLPGPHSCMDAFVSVFGEDGSRRTVRVGAHTKGRVNLDTEEWCGLVYRWYLRTKWVQRLVGFLFLKSYRLFEHVDEQGSHPLFFQPNLNP